MKVGVGFVILILSLIMFCNAAGAVEHWSAPYLARAASCGVDGWWLKYADKEATRLNLAQILSHYLNFLEKEGFVYGQQAKPKLEIKDVGAAAANYEEIIKVTAVYPLLTLSKDGLFQKTAKVKGEEFERILAKLLALNPKLDLANEKTALLVKEKLLPSDFKQAEEVKRYQVVAALVKMTDFFKEKRKPATIAKLEEAVPGLGSADEKDEQEKRSQISVGGILGYVHDDKMAVNFNALAGGKFMFERASLDKRKHLEVVGLGSYYSMVYLVPSSGSPGVRAQSVSENRVDAMVNYKDLYTDEFFDGRFFSSLGLRAIYLNNASSGTSLWGLRGGLEYLRELSDKMKAKLDFGLTAKMLGQSGHSIFGSLTSAMDYSLKVAYSYAPNTVLSLNYQGDAFVFNQENIRYFNSVTVENGWRL